MWSQKSMMKRNKYSYLWEIQWSMFKPIFERVWEFTKEKKIKYHYIWWRGYNTSTNIVFFFFFCFSGIFVEIWLTWIVLDRVLFKGYRSLSNHFFFLHIKSSNSKTLIKGGITSSTAPHPFDDWQKYFSWSRFIC